MPKTLSDAQVATLNEYFNKLNTPADVANVVRFLRGDPMLVEFSVVDVDAREITANDMDQLNHKLI